ncbi:phage tail tape measure protein [Rubellimicrobium rubrum]|uniref:Phage tail tape measure protein n=1 Tax=Rubellimicrobium rubrum TaxID=2585369 RepID=A0A5C4N269_9RHOB|nr:phage tail tape measure protein [Rubellimicrobium rubrum]TNC52797.1 phage tail tape measure protein [Rubellimicrobium rubrum]
MTLFDLDDGMDDLQARMGDATRVASAFSSELTRVRTSLGEATRHFGAVEKGFSGGLRRAIDGLVVDGDRLSQALGTVGRTMIDTVYKAAVKPVSDQLGDALAGGLNGVVTGIMPFADGASFSQKRVAPFTKGGAVSQAKLFPTRGSAGLMDEASLEANMPHTRGTDGRLGARPHSSGAAQVTINVSTPDVAGFQRSQGQIAAEMSRLLGRGARNR